MDSMTCHISATLKTLRQQKGWSLDRTAMETGVSKAMLGQIERQESSPTVATLWKIASGFQVSFSSFLEESPEVSSVIYRPQPAKPLKHADEHLKITSLFPFDKQCNFECMMLELLPGGEHLSTAHAPGVIEHVIVIAGSMEVLIDGQWQYLKQGDGLRFDAGKSHGYRNNHSESAFFHNIIHYPA